MSDRPRLSDRWVTPGVIVAGMLLGTVLVLAVVGSVTFLTWRGLDPAPMLELTAQVGGATFAAGTFLLQLTGRKTTAKVERNTGRLEAVVVETLDALEDERGRHARGPAWPETQPHPLMGAAPVPPRSIGQDTLDAEARQGPPERRGVR